MSDYIGVVTGLIGLATALVTYRASVKRSITNAERRARVLGIKDPTVSIEYWKPKRVLWIEGATGVSYLLILFVVEGWDPRH